MSFITKTLLLISHKHSLSNSSSSLDLSLIICLFHRCPRTHFLLINFCSQASNVVLCASQSPSPLSLSLCFWESSFVLDRQFLLPFFPLSPFVNVSIQRVGIKIGLCRIPLNILNIMLFFTLAHFGQSLFFFFFFSAHSNLMLKGSQDS